MKSKINVTLAGQFQTVEQTIDEFGNRSYISPFSGGEVRFNTYGLRATPQVKAPTKMVKKTLLNKQKRRALKSSRKQFHAKHYYFTYLICMWKTRSRCFYCKRNLNPPERVVLDHYIPQRMNGKHDWTNRVPSCHRCDTLKGGLLPDEFMAQFGGSIKDKEFFPCKKSLGKEVCREYTELVERLSRQRHLREKDIIKKSEIVYPLSQEDLRKVYYGVKKDLTS